MLSRFSMPAALLAGLAHAPVTWAAAEATPGWQTTGYYDGGGWFDQSLSVLNTMQSTYWNGSYWPSSLQWENAVLDTLVAATDRTLNNALLEYDGSVPDSSTTEANIESAIQSLFSDIEAFYGSEDTIQIFGAAYDDAQWVVLEWLEVLKFINESETSIGQDNIAEYAHRAHIFYNIVQNEFDTTLCGGGITWNPALAVYKNAVTNELFISSTIGMYLYFPGDTNTDPYPSPSYTAATGLTLSALPTLAAHDPALLQTAIQAFNWFQSQPFENSQGLIIDGFHISSGQTTCDEPSDSIYTYNQGILLSGLRQLWEATGNETYLNAGYQYIWNVMNATGWYATTSTVAAEWSGLGQYGILADLCDSSDDCSNDARMFKGIYFHHLDLFCEPLPTTTALIPGLTYTASSTLAASHASNCATYAKWVEHNAMAALETRDSSGLIAEWWGAAYSGVDGPIIQTTQVNAGADVMNKPEVLTQSPWKCEGRDCGNNTYHKNAGAILDKARRHSLRHLGKRVTETVETQGSGLGVVKAAADMILSRPASYGGTTSIATSSTTSQATTTQATTTTKQTSTTTTTSGSSTGVAQWGQCGGNGYTGSTVCASPYTCVENSEWWSQCE